MQCWLITEKARSKSLDYLRKAVWKKGVVGVNYVPGTKVNLTFPRLFTEAWEEHYNKMQDYIIQRTIQKLV